MSGILRYCFRLAAGADVVELADTTDLKSVGFGLAGLIPAVRTSLKLSHQVSTGLFV
jgi:hypothetical protein